MNGATMGSDTGFVAALFTLAATSGCRAVQCLPPEPSASVIAEQAVTVSPRMVSGRVLNVDVAPLTHARVRLREADSTWRPVDSAGAFVLRAPRGGTYTLEISARDYGSAVEPIALRSESGLRVLAVLVRTPPTSRRATACLADTVQLKPGER
jgi:hypothetical protein